MKNSAKTMKTVSQSVAGGKTGRRGDTDGAEKRKVGATKGGTTFKVYTKMKGGGGSEEKKFRGERKGFGVSNRRGGLRR